MIGFLIWLGVAVSSAGAPPPPCSAVAGGGMVRRTRWRGREIFATFPADGEVVPGGRMCADVEEQGIVAASRYC